MRSTAVTVRLPVASIVPMMSTCTDWNTRLENKGANGAIK